MGKSQRTKGAVGEREVCDIFAAALGEPVKRNIGQARDGGNDIDIKDLVVEVKRRKTLGTIYGWFAQAFAAAQNFVTGGVLTFRGTPIVVCRQDGGEWIVVLRLTDFIRYWLGWRERGSGGPMSERAKHFREAIGIVQRHKRHVEQSPGVGEPQQAYALAVLDDVAADLNAERIATFTPAAERIATFTPAAETPSEPVPRESEQRAANAYTTASRALYHQSPHKDGTRRFTAVPNE